VVEVSREGIRARRWPGNQATVGRHHDRVHLAHVGDAGRESGDVAHVTPMAAADTDIRDKQLRIRSLDVVPKFGWPGMKGQHRCRCGTAVAVGDP
jgi:hypothetical protein